MGQLAQAGIGDAGSGQLEGFEFVEIGEGEESGVGNWGGDQVEALESVEVCDSPEGGIVDHGAQVEIEAPNFFELRQVSDAGFAYIGAFEAQDFDIFKSGNVFAPYIGNFCEIDHEAAQVGSAAQFGQAFICQADS